jgi:hypothetical protein
MRSRRSLTFSAGDLVFERPKKFILVDPGGMGGGVMNGRFRKQMQVELKDVGRMGNRL